VITSNLISLRHGLPVQVAGSGGPAPAASGAAPAATPAGR